MGYRNIVFCRHEESDYAKSYLFELPLNKGLVKGEAVFVDTMFGKQLAFTTCDSFIVPEDILKNIISGVGAYEPLKSVLSRARKKITYEPVDEIDGLPF